VMMGKKLAVEKLLIKPKTLK